jgi:hypothetical protein
MFNKRVHLLVKRILIRHTVRVSDRAVTLTRTTVTTGTINQHKPVPSCWTPTSSPLHLQHTESAVTTWQLFGLLLPSLFSLSLFVKKSKIRHFDHRRHTKMDPNLSRFNPVHILKCHFPMIHFNIIVPYTPPFQYYRPMYTPISILSSHVTPISILSSHVHPHFNIIVPCTPPFQ